MGSIDPFDIKCRIRFGIAQLLGLLQHLFIGTTRITHGRQDVIAGAVQNALNTFDLIACQTLSQGFDDRNTASNGSLEIQRRAVFFRQLCQFGAMDCDQGLIGGHDMASGL